jgi:prepilin-type N-terminal cleavage/methylation domain-containing protein
MKAAVRTHAEADSGRGGFSLIEVMVALAVLGAALFVLLEAHYAALGNHDQLRNEVKWRNLLGLALGIAEVEVSAGNYADKQEFGRRYPDFSYSFDAQPVGENYPGLFDVLVRVEGPDENRELHAFVMSRDPNVLAQIFSGADLESLQPAATEAAAAQTRATAAETR